MPGLGSQLQNIATAMQGFSAGLQGQLPQFQAVQQQKLAQEQEQARYQQEQQKAMIEQRQKTMFTDANAALQLVKMGNLDGVVQLGINRLQGLQQLAQQFPDIDPSDTQRVTQLAVAARNGDEEALELLTAELESAVQVGQAIGVLEAPETSSKVVGDFLVDDKTGKVIFDASEKEPRERAQDENGVLRFVDTGERVFPQVEKLEDELTDADKFTRAKTIRDQISADTKDFTQIANAWDRISASAEAPSAAGDLALIFNYMKMLDPGSTVREGEFANAQNATGVPGQIRNLFNRVSTGERLSPPQRTDFLSQAQGIFEASKGRADNIINEYVSLGERYGLTRDDVVIERGAAPSIAAPPAIGEIRDGYKYVGPDPADPASWEEQ
jgi:hypothetical protein